MLTRHASHVYRAMQKAGSLAILASAAIRASRRAACSLRLHWFGGRAVLSLEHNGDVLRIPAHHLVYVPDIANEFPLYFSSVEPEICAGKRVVDFSRPRVHRLAGTGLDLMLTSFSEGLRVIENYFRMVSLRAGDVVLDIGANCGLFSIPAAELVGQSGRVIAVEPDPVNCAALRTNIARRGLGNVRVIEAGIWSGSGELPFGSDGSLGSLVLEQGTGFRGRSVIIKTTTLDQLVTDVELDRVRLVKMDAEGAEYHALSGAEKLLACGTAFWLIELHPRPGGSIDRDAVASHFSNSLYTVAYEEQSAGHPYPILVATPRTRESPQVRC